MRGCLQWIGGLTVAFFALLVWAAMGGRDDSPASSGYIDTATSSPATRCPPDAQQRLSDAMAQGLTTDVEPRGLVIRMRRGTLEAFTAPELEALAHVADCAIAGSDGILRAVIIEPADGGAGRTFTGSQLLDLRQRHAANAP